MTIFQIKGGNYMPYLSLEWIMYWKGKNVTKDTIISDDKIRMQMLD